MALALVDSYFGKTAPAAPVTPKAATQQLKRQRAESSTSYESGSKSGQPIPALSSFRTSSRQPNLRGFTRGGSRGSGSGNPFPRGYKRGSLTAAADAAAAGSELLFTVTDTLWQF
jgi:hypothetical protein